MKDYVEEMNRFLWIGNFILNKKIYEINIDCDVQCIIFVDFGLIRWDFFCCLFINIYIFYRCWNSKDLFFFQKNLYSKV